MTFAWLFFATLTVVGSVMYNLSVKSAGEVIHPFVFTVILTFVALAGHLAAFGAFKAFVQTDLKFSFNNIGLFYAAMAGIGVVIIDLAYFYAVKSGGLAISSAFWVVGSLIVTAIVSFLYFQETISMMKAIGIGLGLVSLFFLTRS